MTTSRPLYLHIVKMLTIRPTHFTAINLTIVEDYMTSTLKSGIGLLIIVVHETRQN